MEDEGENQNDDGEEEEEEEEDDDDDDEYDSYWNNNDEDGGDSELTGNFFIPGIAMSSNLMSALGLDSSEVDVKTDWKPPSRAGLDNSDAIVKFDVSQQQLIGAIAKPSTTAWSSGSVSKKTYGSNFADSLAAASASANVNSIG